MKFLFVGLGSIGQRHVRCLRELYGDHVELIAFRQRGLNLEITPDLQAKEGVDLEQRYGIRSFYRLEDALDQKPRAAFICTPNHLHIEIASRLASEGLDLFIEKPVSHDLDGVAELQELLDQNGSLCHVGYQLRFHPGLKEMRSRVESGDLGNIFGSRFDFGEYMPYWHRYEDYSKTFMAKSEQGGGITLTQIHDIDIIYSMFGMPDTVYARGSQSGTLELQAEDNVQSILGYQLHGRPLNVSLTHDCLRYPPRRSYEIHGTKGSLHFDAYLNRLTWSPFDASPEVVFEDSQYARNTLFLHQIEHFVECMQTREEPVVSLADGVNSLKIALAIKESMKCDREVELVT